MISLCSEIISQTPTRSAARHNTGALPSSVDTFDVLCSNSGEAFHHPGNVIFRNLIRRRRLEYQQAKEPHLQDDVVNGILVLIQRAGGRFLKNTDGVWLGLSHYDQYEKVKNALNHQSKVTESLNESQKDPVKMLAPRHPPRSDEPVTHMPCWLHQHYTSQEATHHSGNFEANASTTNEAPLLKVFGTTLQDSSRGPGQQVTKAPLYEHCPLSRQARNLDRVAADDKNKAQTERMEWELELQARQQFHFNKTVDERREFTANEGPIRYGCSNGKKWNHHYQCLVEFRRKHGHCLVPCQRDSSLARWTQRVRCQYKQFCLQGRRFSGGLSPERVAALEQLGFVWSVQAYNWEMKFQQLVEFREAHGHCQVPFSYTAQPALADWVKIQRQKYRNTMAGKATRRLHPSRMQRLDKIGFDVSNRFLKQPHLPTNP